MVLDQGASLSRPRRRLETPAPSTRLLESLEYGSHLRFCTRMAAARARRMDTSLRVQQLRQPRSPRRSSDRAACTMARWCRATSAALCDATSRHALQASASVCWQRTLCRVSAWRRACRSVSAVRLQRSKTAAVMRRRDRASMPAHVCVCVTACCACLRPCQVCSLHHGRSARATWDAAPASAMRCR